MKPKIICFILFLVCGLGVSQNSPLQFNLLRQNDNVDTLKQINSKNTYQKIKYVYLDRESYLSFGGSWRFQYESFINEQFQNRQDQDNLWYLNRLMLHTHLRIKDKFQLFAEINSSLIGNKDNKSPVDKDELSINQLFFNYKLLNNWSVTIGRQNLKLGSGRLVDVREGPNVRRSFDVAQLYYHKKGFSATTFFAIPVQPKPHIFDNELLRTKETFSALYTTTILNNSSGLDAYIFHQKDNEAIYNNLQGNERRWSLGLRYFGSISTLKYNNELVYQFGSMENQNISAWTISFQLENKTKLHNHIYNLGVKTGIISGDRNKNDSTLNTFDALYPRGAYFGKIARFGPSNLIDIHPYINTNFKKLFIELDYDVFWRQSTNDGVYNAALVLEYPDVNNQKFIGQQIGTIIGYQVNNHINLELESNIIFPGAFLKQSNQGDTLYHFVLTTEIKF